ncbi:acetyl-CoA C-acyltransferase family protein [Pseudomonas sp. GD03721]|nr:MULTISPECIES: acetyl-CoA C-acyltransferase family protein [unclassified Pseudomonas]MDH1440434.1 acetyl-CoA C-acyltransferase family protein [Pseudomonas sp. GD03722]WGG03478.1 acetyl-CoA C-acyltransferase family protein [Pseudomonas sp. GD03721]WGG07646.1 acetyl-CoA C-acyltransferase family protein [Pseudomonas sp. GD03919]
MKQREVVVLSGVRTAIGRFGGSLKDVPLTQLATTAVKAALERSAVDPASVGHVVMGNVIPTLPTDAYLSRVAGVDAGIPIETPAFNVNRLCGSGLQAIVSAAQSILLGDAQVAVAGGAESMSRGPYILPSNRWGARLGDATIIDYMNAILHDPWKKLHMGVTAENIAERYGVSREQQDQLALESQKRAARAIAKGWFKEQIVPVSVGSGKHARLFDTDEHVRADVTLEQLAAMRPAFRENGKVTAGNSSGLNDGAAALVLAERQYAEAQGLKPLARLVGYAHAGVDPDFMGMGPVPSTRKLMERTGLTLEQMDVIEINEAFAAQAFAVASELGLDLDKVNVNGSGISLGHPVGATGALISVKAIHELQRTQGRYALVSLCIGGGQGISAIYERL